MLSQLSSGYFSKGHGIKVDFPKLGPKRQIFFISFRLGMCFFNSKISEKVDFADWFIGLGDSEEGQFLFGVILGLLEVGEVVAAGEAERGRGVEGSLRDQLIVLRSLVPHNEGFIGPHGVFEFLDSKVPPSFDLVLFAPGEGGRGLFFGGRGRGRGRGLGLRGQRGARRGGRGLRREWFRNWLGRQGRHLSVRGEDGDGRRLLAGDRRDGGEGGGLGGVHGEEGGASGDSTRGGTFPRGHRFPGDGHDGVFGTELLEICFHLEVLLGVLVELEGVRSEPGLGLCLRVLLLQRVDQVFCLVTLPS